jgi:hypothetical protein
MSIVADFHSINEVNKPEADRVYHNNNSCGPGKEIPPKDKRDGRNGYRFCHDCEKKNNPGLRGIKKL